MVKGMKLGTPPKEHFERNEGKLGHTCNIKYSSEFGSAQDADKNNKALSDFAKKKKMNY